MAGGVALTRSTLLGAGRALAALAACLPLLAAGAIVSSGDSVAWYLALASTLALAAAVVTRRLRLVTVALAGSLFLIFLGAGLDAVRVDSDVDLQETEVGIPLDYVRFQSSLTPEIFPQTVSWNPWEDPATVEMVPLLANWALVGVPLVLVARFFSRGRPT